MHNESKTFEEYLMQEQQGFRPVGNLSHREYTQAEAAQEDKYIVDIKEKTKDIEKSINPKDEMLAVLAKKYPLDFALIEQVEPYPLTILGHADGGNLSLPFGTVAISREILKEGLDTSDDSVDERERVKVDKILATLAPETKFVEVNFFKLLGLNKEVKLRIFATIMNWQRMLNLKISYVGVIGH